MTPETFEQICNGIADGNSLRSQLEKFKAYRNDFYKTVDLTPENKEQYARSIKDGCESMADDIQSISDEPVPMTDRGLDSAAVAQNRLRVDARKWLLSKRMPKKYGDKVQTELSGVDGTPLTVVLNMPAKKPVEVEE